MITDEAKLVLTKDLILNHSDMTFKNVAEATTKTVKVYNEVSKKKWPKYRPVKKQTNM